VPSHQPRPPREYTTPRRSKSYENYSSSTCTCIVVAGGCPSKSRPFAALRLSGALSRLARGGQKGTPLKKLGYSQRAGRVGEEMTARLSNVEGFYCAACSCATLPANYIMLQLLCHNKQDYMYDEANPPEQRHGSGHAAVSLVGGWSQGCREPR
jgi:hypothetical protein